MSKMFSFLGSLVLKSIRACLGWQKFRGTRENSIGVFVHTSYWDGFIFLLYSHDACAIALTKPQLFNWFTSYFLNVLGFISAPKLEDRGQNGVQKIIKAIRSTEAFLTGRPLTVAISPKGTILNRPWRSGYKVIAQQLDWPVRPVIIDYANRKLEILDAIDFSKDNAEDLLKEALSSSVPRHPERSEIKLQKFNEAELKYIPDLIFLSNLCMLPSVLKYFLLGHYTTFAIGLCANLSSLFYHEAKESKYIFLDVFFARFTVSWFFYSYASKAPMVCFAALAGSLYCYLRACGRQNTPERTEKYIFWHSLFHVCISIACYTAFS